MKSLLKNKVCLITGAGKGIGKAITAIFQENGAKLALITRSQEDINKLKIDFGTDDNRFYAFCGDVSDPEIVKEFVEQAVNTFGHIDVLVNNAGMRFRKKFLEINTDEFLEVMNVNLGSIFHLCQAVLPHMAKRKQGKIINMSSIAGTRGFNELSGYVTSKAAIIGLTKALAIEFAKQNIQINALAPGFCKTSYFQSFKQNKELYSYTLERTPMHRWGESDEVANVCLFLASDLSSYITGDVISVDGGWSA